MLPYLADWPVNMHRYPPGRQQRVLDEEVPSLAPEWIGRGRQSWRRSGWARWGPPRRARGRPGPDRREVWVPETLERVRAELGASPAASPPVRRRPALLRAAWFGA